MVFGSFAAFDVPLSHLSFAPLPTQIPNTTEDLLASAAHSLKDLSDVESLMLSKKPRTKKANTKTYGGERFPIKCPNSSCVIGHTALERLGGTGGSREGYHCQLDRGGCGNRFSQRTYCEDESTHKFGSHNPCIRACTTRSYREKRLKITPTFRFIVPVTQCGRGTQCLRSKDCPKINGHKGRCISKFAVNATVAARLALDNTFDSGTETFAATTPIASTPVAIATEDNPIATEDIPIAIATIATISTAPPDDIFAGLQDIIDQESCRGM